MNCTTVGVEIAKRVLGKTANRNGSPRKAYAGEVLKAFVLGNKNDPAHARSGWLRRCPVKQSQYKPEPSGPRSRCSECVSKRSNLERCR
jgi:hypothetical protein